MKIVLFISMILLVTSTFAQQTVSPQSVEDTVAVPVTMTDSVPVSSVTAITGDTSVLQDTIPVTDGYFQANTALEGAVPFQYPKVDPANIRFYKRVWRDIDLADQRNQLLGVKGASLIEAIMKDIAAGKLTPYEPSEDSFKHRLSAREGSARFQDSVLVPIFDQDGNQIESKMVLNDFDPAKVTKFRIKEDIFLDKQRGRVETRIIGVAPMMNVTTSDSTAQSVGSTPAFWLYFPQLRYTLVKMDVSDPERDLFEMTMDDVFVQRKFVGTIVREASASRQGVAGEEGMDADKMERRIEDFKKNLWQNPDGTKVLTTVDKKKKVE